MDIEKAKQANILIKKINSLEEKLIKLESAEIRNISVRDGEDQQNTELAYFYHNDIDVKEFLKKKEQKIEDRIEYLKKQIEAL